MLFFILKLLGVLILLAAFLRRPSRVRAIGLLTMTGAFLIDTFLSSFGWEPVRETLGFFFYVFVGIIAGGAALWLWGAVRPMVGEQPQTVPAFTPASKPPVPPQPETSIAFDRQELYEQIRNRLGSEELRDVVFDLELNENDIFTPGTTATASIPRLMDVAAAEGKLGALALAVERILTPIVPDDLPRVEKLSAASPPPVLRLYLLAHFRLADLSRLAEALGIDWEQLGNTKRDIARNLLLYLSRRNRLHELITILQSELAATEDENEPLPE